MVNDQSFNVFNNAVFLDMLSLNFVLIGIVKCIRLCRSTLRVPLSFDIEIQ